MQDFFVELSSTALDGEDGFSVTLEFDDEEGVAEPSPSRTPSAAGEHPAAVRAARLAFADLSSRLDG